MTNWFLEAMRWIYSLTCAISESGFGNVFLTILISTILLRALTIFSDIKTRKSSAKMAEVQPEIQRLQKKYANDPRRFQAEQTKLMKEKGVSMWGSCLPMLITMPLFFCFIAAFRYWGYEMNLRLLVDENAMELFKSFKFLWINNIWQPDNGLTPVLANGASFLATPQLSNLLYLQEPGVGEKLVEMGLAVTKVYQGGVSYQILSNDAAIAIYDAAIQPFLDVYKGYNNGWFIMSILAGGTNFLSAWLMTKNTPAANEEAAKSTKWMNYLFPVMSFIFCLNYNAAFAIYWTLTSVIMIIVNLILNKKFPRTEPAKEDANK
ncbi:MAG: YidC/Oxa1 family membrane protein insertase [Eubacteriales bacterium]|nr:YidC/Oxa1 family membrane protein insertase [Eubacteriales bacterium]MCI6669494.1 YidC/Oxa1 family membrane protein insertase [Christensenellaceae bacterium]MCI6943742.1 YidC/Oxa1 family membrane protein insertase [Christensenellaceae bacterium]MDY4696041.1 YidC/Oxa1 family membrane protein insertase [Eubacteriales bacterium]